MAFVSKTPGRTQVVNFYRVGSEMVLVDLPGYGFAKVPEAVRRKWDLLVTSYLFERKGLALVLLVDASQDEERSGSADPERAELRTSSSPPRATAIQGRLGSDEEARESLWGLETCPSFLFPRPRMKEGKSYGRRSWSRSGAEAAPRK
jgi:hypothetical protein